ncbi:Ger(x)C family spore germination protein [Natroniella sulfidigena]|uniref:Ger(x)C family spore germination protein n=1 Tax=Natroniella sulfidigena TaxID=723921 RepID=UPI00200A9263|nr:Ger(x)C family spore germination protein [Natroniella sulfidigena]MCK8815815.1 Ger(x)C family spore germination protein [Natroniella sulfidigena]
MRKKVLILILLSLIIFLVGCWNYTEMKDRTFVVGTAIDLADNDLIEVTTQLLKPHEIGVPAAGEPAPDVNPIWVVSSQGETIFDAIRNFVRQAGRRLFWQYNNLIVVGEEAARAGMLPLLELFIRDHELRLGQRVVITRGDAKDIIGATHDLERIPSMAIVDMLREQEAMGGIIDVDLFDFLEQYNSRAGAPVVGVVELMNGEQLHIEGGAVFKKDRLQGFLDKRETRGYNWVVDGIGSTIMVLEWEDERKLSIEIQRSESSVEPVFRDGRLVMEVEIETEGGLAEQHTPADLTRLDRWFLVEEKLVRNIENEIEDTIELAQREFEADIFGFADEVYRKYPEEWRRMEGDWEDEFATLEVEVDVEAKIRRTFVTRTFPSLD